MGNRQSRWLFDSLTLRPQMNVPLCDLRAQYESLKDEIDVAMQAVGASGHFILGPNVKAFEEEMAAYVGCEHAVGVASGTDALHLALRALQIGPGDEVITTPFTFIATTEAIGMVGARPVFVDIDPRTFNIDPNLIEDAITPRTKAILPVHLYGQSCDMDAIMDIANRHSVRVVEDCAQSLGATYKGSKVGTFGDVGCLSFFPSKNLGCFGDGGMVVTDNPSVYERVEYLRRHGGKVKYHHEELGLNSRLDELQAAILRVKLQHLDRWNSMRRQRAYRYNRLLANLKGVIRPAELANNNTIIPVSSILSQTERGLRGHVSLPFPVGKGRGEGPKKENSAPASFAPDEADTNPLLKAVYHQYTIIIDNRDAAREYLNNAGIGCAVYYPVPLHLQKVHDGIGYQQVDFPCAERAAQACLSLPMYPELTYAQQMQAVECLCHGVAGRTTRHTRNIVAA